MHNCLTYIFLSYFLFSCTSASFKTNLKISGQLNEEDSFAKSEVLPEGKIADSANTVKEFLNKSTANISKGQYYNEVPDWYMSNRVQIHTRLTLDDINKPDFFEFPKKLAKYNVSVLTRQIKSGDEEPWWNSKVGTLNAKTASFNSSGQNLAKRIIDQMHSLNMKAIIYYRHLEDAEMFRQHPDWACRDVDGKILKNARGVTMSFSSPYRDVVIERLKELASYGADGFYFDEVHIPFRGDFSSYSQKSYKEIYGVDMVADFKKGNILRYYDFRNNIIKKFFEDVRNALGSGTDAPVMLISGNNWPTLTDLHMNSQIFSEFILKSESNMPVKLTTTKSTFKMPEDLKIKTSIFGLNAFDYSYMRDNSAGPPHIWCPRLRTEDEVIATSSALIALGCIANLDIDIKSSLIDNFKQPLKWNSQYEEYFKRLKPYGYIGLYISENERNMYIKDPSGAWREMLMPAYTTFQKLYDAGIPVRILSDAYINKTTITPLAKVYCDESKTDLPTEIDKTKFTDFKNLPNGNEKQVAISLDAPVYVRKENKEMHINFFTNDDNFLYILSAKDLAPQVKSDNEKVVIPIKSMQSINAAGSSFKLYIKLENIIGDEIEDIANKKSIKSSSTDDGYKVFDISNNGNVPLCVLRFKFK